ncbi:unnamed protein product [Clavelina lepadiformis]|uniref:Uncharacterized protein n=1 Tax=Clavelina lepadiformis TaxID=159417 RepID=A0ABP0GHL7_CLALP
MDGELGHVLRKSDEERLRKCLDLKSDDKGKRTQNTDMLAKVVDVHADFHDLLHEAIMRKSTKGEYVFLKRVNEPITEGKKASREILRQNISQSMTSVLTDGQKFDKSIHRTIRKLPFGGEPINSLLPRKAKPLDDRNVITLTIRAKTLHQYFLSDSFCSSKTLQMLEFFALREMYLERQHKCFSKDSCLAKSRGACFQSSYPADASMILSESNAKSLHKKQ